MTIGGHEGGMTTLDNLSFNIVGTHNSSASGPRLGRFSVEGRRPVETPSYIAITSRGLIPHLTPDNVKQCTLVPGIYLALEDFIEKQPQSIPPIFNLPNSSDPLKDFLGASKNSLVILSARRTPPVPCPASNTATAISVLTSVGFHPLSNEEYVEAAVDLKADITVGLGDVIYGSKAGIKRVEKMVDRTTDWTAAMIAECKTGASRPTNLFAPLLALDAQKQSAYLDFLQESGQDVSGLALYTPEVLLSLPAALSSLPRLALTEPMTPHTLLSEIGLGIELHTIPFIAAATDNGIALCFEFPAILSAEAGPMPLGMNMWLSAHSTSLAPLKSDCVCYSCRSHHRAYIQHLLVAKEMLGWVLLQIHNLAVIDQFYMGIRNAIKDNTFEEEAPKFERKYERSWPETTGIGPRLRGYQFKNEGAGEKKKNIKAYGRFEEPVVESNCVTDDGNLKPDIDSIELEKIGFAEKHQ